MIPKNSALRPEFVPSKVRSVPSIRPSTHPLASLASPRLTVVIVNYNGWDDVSRLVESLSRAPEVASGRCEVVVVDNASDGPVPPTFLPAPPGVRLIVREDNGGFAVGVNAGWRASRSPWLLLLNPDVEAEPGLIGRILARIDGHESHEDGPPGIVGFALKNPDGTRQPSVGVEPGLVRSLMGQFIPRSRRKYQSGWRVRNGPVPWVTGACLLADASLMRDLGGLDEDFFLYYEEVALCRSARALGRRVEFDDSVAVVHLRPLQDRPVSPRMRVIVRHGKLLYFRKHLPRWQFSWMGRIIAAEARIRGAAARWRGDRAAIGSWRAIGAMANAMRRGETIRGREILAMADAATSVRHEKAGGLIGRRRVPPARASSNRGVGAS